jgi:probable F420-dependent oxidoreductase
MKLGFNVPNLGPAASPDNVVKLAQKAEELGYDSIWTTERLLVPVNPSTGYGGFPGVPIPEQYKVQLDPLDTLSVVAAVTKRPRLGTSVLVLPFYSPALLARRLATIDIFSGGRLTVGFGVGWCPEEFAAAGVPMRQRGKRADESLQLLKAVWTKDPVEFQGKFWNIPPSTMQPKPVQKPHPPILMAAFAPASMKRLATMADGWLPVALPVPAMKQMWDGIKGMAKEAGRDPSKLQLVVRANFAIGEAQGDGRMIFTGSEEQIKQDIKDVRELGADEVHFDPTTGPQGDTAKGWFQSIEHIRELAG